MRVVTIYGGPRPMGNTATVLGWVEEALRSRGHAVERSDLASLRIGGCSSCYACFASKTEPGCRVEDDANGIFDRMIAADAVVFASPLYMWGIAGPLKQFLDRTCCLVKDFQGPDYASLIAGKPAALIVTCLGPEANNADLVGPQFERWTRYAKLPSLGTWVVSGCSEPSELGDETEREAVELAAKLVATA